MPEYALDLPRMRRDQWEMISHPAKVKFAPCGRRWGKTTAGGAMALGVAANGYKVAWVVPEYKNGRPLWRWAEQATGTLAKHKIAIVNKSDRVISFSNGGFLGLYSADNPNSIRSEAFHLAILDEAAYMPPEVFYDVIMPTLADYDGSLYAISTPRGRNWFYDEYLRGLNDGKYQASFTAPTSANPMPTIQRAFQMAKERLPDRTFRQEWLAEFVEDGGVFRNLRACVYGQMLAYSALPSSDYVIGVDLGKSNDYTVFMVYDLRSKRVVYYERTRDEYTTQLKRLYSMYQQLKPLVIGVESNIGAMFIEQAQKMRLPIRGFATTAQSKPLIIDNLTLAIERQEIGLPDDAIMLGELTTYESKRSPGGNITYSAPPGMHDDTVMALAIAYHMAQSSARRRVSLASWDYQTGAR